MQRRRWAVLAALVLAVIVGGTLVWRGSRPAPRTPSHRATAQANPSPKPPPPARPKAPPPPPLMDSKGRAVVVDWNAGLVYPLRNGQPVRRPIVANPGADFHRHYLGSFVITEKQVEHRSNLYNEHIGELQPGEVGADMPYWQRIGPTAVGFHLSHLWEPERGLHASMGCYRLSAKSARWLFHWTDIGTPVHVVKSLCGTKWAYLAPGRCEVVASAQE